MNEMEDSSVVVGRKPISGCEIFLHPLALIVRLTAKLRGALLGGHESRSFVAHVSATFVVRIVLIVVGLVSSIMTARALGPAGRGLFTSALVLGAIGSQFGNLGLHSANTYYLGQDRTLLPRIFSNAIAVAVGVGGGIAAALGFVFWLRPAWAPVHGYTLLGGLLLIPALLALLLLQNLLLALREVKYYNVSELTTRAGFVAVFAFLWLVFHIVSPTEVVFFSLSATCISICISGVRLLSITRGLPLPSFSLLRSQASYGVRSYLTCLAGYIVLKSDILLVKYLAGDTATGLYSLASSMTDFIYTFPSVVGMILFPMLSSTGTMDARWRRARKTMAGIAVIMSAISLTAALLAAPAVRIAFGSRFLPAVPAFLVLSVAIVFYGANSVISIFFSSCGQPWFSVFVWIGGALLNIGLNFLLIPRWGIVGAAYSSLIAYIALFFVQYTIAPRYARHRRAPADTEVAA